MELTFKGVIGNAPIFLSDKSDSDNCREESKVRSYGVGEKETILDGVMREGVSEVGDLSSELKGENPPPQLGVSEHFLAKEVVYAKVLRQTKVGMF